MKTIIVRAAFAALLATTVGVGFAQAQISPADPNYEYETREKIAPFGAVSTSAYTPATRALGSAALTARAYAPAALNARAEVIEDGQIVGQDPDANVRLQLRKSDGIFDR